jgi:hypothetical protein
MGYCGYQLAETVDEQSSPGNGFSGNRMGMAILNRTIITAITAPIRNNSVMGPLVMN